MATCWCACRTRTRRPATTQRERTSVVRAGRGIDGCWEWSAEVNLELVAPVLLDFAAGRQAMQRKYGVNFFLASWTEAASGLTFLPWGQGGKTTCHLSSTGRVPSYTALWRTGNLRQETA